MTEKKGPESTHRQDENENRSQDPVLSEIPVARRDEAWVLWQKAARSMAENMIEDCNYWISRLQPGKRGLTGEECFHLWSSLGELRFHLWSKTLPIDEAERIIKKSQELQKELSEAVVRSTSPHARASILMVRLETEVNNAIEKINNSIRVAKRLLEKHDLAESWDQTEFDTYIQTPMDHIGYTSLLLDAMKLPLAHNSFEALDLLHRDLKNMFPKAAAQYRESGHTSIDTGRPVWPRSFWWRYSVQ